LEQQLLWAGVLVVSTGRGIHPLLWMAGQAQAVTQILLHKVVLALRAKVIMVELPQITVLFMSAAEAAVLVVLVAQQTQVMDAVVTVVLALTGSL
jgi:hypothetical protein